MLSVTVQTSSGEFNVSLSGGTGEERVYYLVSSADPSGEDPHTASSVRSLGSSFLYSDSQSITLPLSEVGNWVYLITESPGPVQSPIISRQLLLSTLTFRCGQNFEHRDRERLSSISLGSEQDAVDHIRVVVNSWADYGMAVDLLNETTEYSARYFRMSPGESLLGFRHLDSVPLGHIYNLGILVVGTTETQYDELLLTENIGVPVANLDLKKVFRSMVHLRFSIFSRVESIGPLELL